MLERPVGVGQKCVIVASVAAAKTKRLERRVKRSILTVVRSIEGHVRPCEVLL